MGENLNALVTRAEQATMGYLELLDLLLEEEVGVREGRRFPCQAGYSVSFTTLDDLVRTSRTPRPREVRQEAADLPLKPTVLVVDEVGYLPTRNDIST